MADMLELRRHTQSITGAHENFQDAHRSCSCIHISTNTPCAPCRSPPWLMRAPVSCAGDTQQCLGTRHMMRRSVHWATACSGAQPALSEGASRWNARLQKCCRQDFLSLIRALMHVSASLTLHVVGLCCGTPTSGCFSEEACKATGLGCASRLPEAQNMLLAVITVPPCPRGDN